MSHTPTVEIYGTFEDAYRHFNTALFNDALPLCLITIQRKRGAYGYFSGNRFGKVGTQGETTDEIAMNPMHFNNRSIREVLSTLVHEMAHLWQHHFGEPSRSSYHNKEWAKKMKDIGLYPSSTGAPGGNQTGQQVSHYIIAEGLFDRACAAWLEQNPAPLYHDRAEEGEGAKKNTTRVKFICPQCRAAAWGKPTLKLMCGDCEIKMESEA